MDYDSGNSKDLFDPCTCKICKDQVLHSREKIEEHLFKVGFNES
jgi:hypothetical protein